MKSDLHTLSDRNTIFKYTDDTNLLASEHNDVMLTDKCVNIQKGACCNKMIKNYSKTKETASMGLMLANFFVFFDHIKGIAKVSDAKFLSVL
jgi:hypothetical protein